MVTHQTFEPSSIWWVQFEIYNDLGDHETWKPTERWLFSLISSIQCQAFDLHRGKKSTYKKGPKRLCNVNGRHCLSRNWKPQSGLGSGGTRGGGKSRYTCKINLNLKEKGKAHKCQFTYHISVKCMWSRCTIEFFEARIRLIWARTNNLKHNNYTADTAHWHMSDY